MIAKTRIMLYVDNVQTISEFWQTNLKAQVVENLELPEKFVGTVLQLSPTTELALFSKEFIRKYSPEVLDNLPSLMLFVDNFEQLHAQLPNTGVIMADNDIATFNFSDPEGNYFVIAKNS